MVLYITSQLAYIDQYKKIICERKYKIIIHWNSAHVPVRVPGFSKFFQMKIVNVILESIHIIINTIRADSIMQKLILH